MGGNWVPGAVAVGLLLLVGFLFPLITSSFVDQDSIQTSGFTNTTVDLINDGYNFTINLPVIPDFTGTLPSPIPDFAKDELTKDLTYMTLIPQVILIPLLILISLGFLWTIIKLVVPG